MIRQINTIFLSLCLFLVSQTSFASGYSWELSSINYDGLLNYKGQDINKIASSEAASAIYGELLSESSTVFTTVQSALENSIQTEMNSSPSYKSLYQGSTVTVGSSLGIKMQGMGSYSQVTLALPSASAAVALKKSWLSGLIVLTCTVNLNFPNLTLSGNLNLATGVVSQGVLQGTPTDSVTCSDNFPIISQQLAALAGQIAENLLNKETSPLFASLASGIDLKGQTFLGLPQALTNAQFIIGGVNYGQILASDLETLVNSTEVDLTLYKPGSRLPASAPTTSNSEFTTVQPILNINFPLVNISSSLTLQQLYTASGGATELPSLPALPIPKIPAGEPAYKLPVTSPIRAFGRMK